MGSRTISSYSYDERMKATLQVEIDKQIQTKIVPLPKEEEKEKSESTDSEDKHSELRKRNVRKGTDEDEGSEWVKVEEDDIKIKDNDIKLTEKKETTKNNKDKSRDPLHWFGLLVSPSLRTSQEHFKSATEQLVQQVNKINELKMLEKRYQELREEKILYKLEEITLTKASLKEEDIFTA
ncbi:MAG: hypothetical protein EXX96DRAFT_575754 [Benjaminiella poitrasii]|nr:MAG: hypothetical protein EXX96DRAFT_575754 [Benjaminiella poitrasii]